MSDDILLLGPEPDASDPLAGLPAARVRTRAEIRKAVADCVAEHLWVAPRVHDLLPLLSFLDTDRCSRRALRSQSVVVLQPLTPAQRTVFPELFRRVLAPDEHLRLLPTAELVDVLSAPDRADYLVAVAVDADSGVAVLYRGNLEALVVPFSWFRTPGQGTAPDFADFAVGDFGQTVRFGEYEAAASAILYAFDSDYRKRAKERELGLDRSIGGSVRRLRLFRGLRQSDFPGISAKEIGRIERGDIQKPHAATLVSIAARLGVSVEELRSY
ncbi:MAG TPA: helix-turn-helix transcriptional regulator [Longimicrobiaceae bacterium]